MSKTDFNNTQPSPMDRFKQARRRIGTCFPAGADLNRFHQYTRFVDEMVLMSLTQADRSICAVAALGGYGRREMCLHSSVGLLFLFEKEMPPRARELLEKVVYPLWDAGLRVFHTTRTRTEPPLGDPADLSTLTAFLDARFMGGDADLYAAWSARVEEEAINPFARKWISALREAQLARHRRHGDGTLLLEPHLKEGRGGLRDYHTIRWIARVESGLTKTRDLEYFGYLSHEQYREMIDAAAFVMTVRNCLHIESGRKNDHLRFSDQRRIAGALGYEESEGQLPVERFLGELHARMVVLKRRFLSFAREMSAGAGNESISIGVSSAAVTGGLEIRRGLLQFESAAVVKKNPRLLIWIFYESANRHIPVGGEAKRLIRDFLPLIDADYRKDPVVLETFEGILEIPDNEIEILDEMLETGLLTTLFPEWEPIVNRIQYDEYHRYPVDRHSIRTVENVKRICKEGDIALAAVCKSTEARVSLLWAALFHDVGKGSPGREHSAKGAEILYQALEDRGFSSSRAETAAFLVREHLLLARTATRRDIGDEDTAVFCARRVGNATRLEQLYLLTIADSRATGPKAWNPWTDALLRELFFNVRNVLEGGVLGSRETQEIIASKTAAVLNDPITSNASQEIERLIASMSPRYLLDADPEDIRKHIRLYRNLKKGGMFSWEIEKIEQEKTRRVTICAHDQPGLLSMISGALTLHTFDILDVQVHTWRNNIALDIFTVTPPVDPLYEENKWRRATTDLADALTGNGDLKTLLIDRLGEARIRTSPSREGGVVVDNETSRFFTIIELFIDGEPGLLFRVTDALFRLKLDIRYAKIAAEADLFVLVFYVRDINGEKLDDATEIEGARREIERVVGLRSDTAGRSDPGITIKPTK